ncbi:MAG TPA: MFS transporter [Stellaceae bacterium]|nr:MFS transporter [Stellaceae bacterium]
MAEERIVDVSLLIERHKVGGFQMLVAFLCALAVFMDGFDTQMMGYVIPAIAHSLSVPPPALTRVVVAGLIGLMVGALVFGIVADRVGRKSVIILCLVLFGVFMLLTPSASTVGGLMGWRFLTGLGLGGAMPLAIALTAEYSPQKSRATVVMTMFFGFSLGAAVAGFATAALVQNLGWPAVFYAGGALPLLLVPVMLAALPESIRVLALRGSEGEKLARLMQRIAPEGGFTAATRFVLTEEKATGVPVAHLFRERRAPSTTLLWIMFFMNLLCLFFLATWLPTVITSRGLSLGFAASATALMQIGGCIGTLCFGPLIDRFGAYAVLGIGYIGAAIFIALIGSAGALEAMIMAMAFGAGFCVVGGQNAMNAVASTIYPTYIRSTGVGWALGIGRIGTMLGAAMGGLLLALHLPIPTVFTLAALPALLTAAATFGLGRAERRRGEGAGAAYAPSAVAE